MNSPILWWTAPRALQLNRSKSTFFTRLANAAMAALAAAPLVLAPVRAQTPGMAKAPTPPQLQVDTTPLQRSTGEITSFAPIVDKVGPSVVTVFTSKNVKGQANPLEGNPMLRRFFGIPDDSGPDGDEGEGGKVDGLGSGVIISADGLILTNNHVAEAGDDIKVRIGDHGQQYKAKVVGNDPSSDVALLKIDAKNLPVITFADSDQVKVGDVVLAMGNPFALTNTVTHGIVSALGRGGMGITDYGNFIQTDASINPGNSGGALVDTEGRLIGMNTAIFSRSGGNEGIGFAVPSNLVRTVVTSLLKNGKVSRGYLGTAIEPLTPDLAQQFGVSGDQQGALITDIAPEGAAGAAAKAGLQDGDIITEVNGKAVAGPNELRLTIGGMSPGDKVTLTYLRNGHTQNVECTLGAEPTNDQLAQNDTPANPHPNVLDGITVGDLDDAARSQINAPGDLKGVVVTDVSEDSVGFDAGLRKGDVILDMNHVPLATADQAVDAGNRIAKTERVLLHVWSQGHTDYLVLKPKES
jgi:serine protease Do